MNKDDKPAAPRLNTGQLWRVQKRYVLIVALENLWVRFKWMDAPGQSGERSLTADYETLWHYLLSREGRVVGSRQI